jgi:hypothetical protein
MHSRELQNCYFSFSSAEREKREKRGEESRDNCFDFSLLFAGLMLENMILSF